MSGFLHGVAGIAFFMVGIVCALAAPFVFFSGDIFSGLVLALVAWGCWAGLTKITRPFPA